MPTNDILPHFCCKQCHCNPVLSTAIVREEEILFYQHVSFDLADVCERVGIKTNEVWEIKFEI
jgi:hypothetical protein